MLYYYNLQLIHHIAYQSPSDSLTDIVKMVPAALSLLSHCVIILASVLDQPLPYPLVLPIAVWYAHCLHTFVYFCTLLYTYVHSINLVYSDCCSEYGRIDRKTSSVIRCLAKLDDNITFLCFTQVSCRFIKLFMHDCKLHLVHRMWHLRNLMLVTPSIISRH